MHVVGSSADLVVNQQAGELLEYRKNAKKAARELGYGTKVQKKIETAESINEIRRIMVDARHEKIREDDKKHGRL